MPPILQTILAINQVSNANLDAAEQNLKQITKTLNNLGVK